MSIFVSHHQLIIVVGLVERDKKILILRRIDPEHEQWHQRWGFPGGKIELNETPVEALKREVKEETSLNIHSEKLLGVSTKQWNTPKGIQQTFILLYHCNCSLGDVHLNDEENDEYSWEKPEAIVERSDLLEGNVEMFQQFYLKNLTLKDSVFNDVYY